MPCGMCRTENMLSLYYISARFPNDRTGLKRSCRNTATRSFMVSMTSKLPAIRAGVAACCKLGKDHWLALGYMMICGILALGYTIWNLAQPGKSNETGMIYHAPWIWATESGTKTETKNLTPAASRATSLGYLSSISVSGISGSKALFFNLAALVPGPCHTCHAGCGTYGLHGATIN